VVHEGFQVYCQRAKGVRTTTLGYGAVDGIRQKFTSQERDNETGLDYMHARYFASAQGRFSNADTVAGSIGNPQSLNRYAYVNNNRLNFTDPGCTTFLI
jgi:RHS repeat-associated protein